MEDEPITEFQSFSPYYFKIALFIQLLNPVSLSERTSFQIEGRDLSGGISED